MENKRKLTPQEIRNQEFSKKLFGYDPDEVDIFLSTVANAYEDLLKEVNRLRAQTPEYKAEELVEKARRKIERIVEEKKKELNILSKKREEVEIEIEKLRLTQKRMANKLKAAIIEMTRLLKELEEDAKGKEIGRSDRVRGEGSAQVLQKQNRESGGREAEDKGNSSS
jgi:DivIVA domain-containing protein